MKTLTQHSTNNSNLFLNYNSSVILLYNTTLHEKKIVRQATYHEIGRLYIALAHRFHPSSVEYDRISETVSSTHHRT